MARIDICRYFSVLYISVLEYSQAPSCSEKLLLKVLGLGVNLN